MSDFLVEVKERLKHIPKTEEGDRQYYIHYKEDVPRLLAVVDAACEELADHQCPEEFDLAKWAECVTCPKDKEVRYDAQRDIDCWRRYLMEKAKKGE